MMGFIQKMKKLKVYLMKKWISVLMAMNLKSIRQALTYSKAKFFGDKENTNLSLKEKDPEKLQEIEGFYKKC